MAPVFTRPSTVMMAVPAPVTSVSAVFALINLCVYLTTTTLVPKTFVCPVNACTTPLTALTATPAPLIRATLTGHASIHPDAPRMATPARLIHALMGNASIFQPTAMTMTRVQQMTATAMAIVCMRLLALPTMTPARMRYV